MTFELKELEVNKPSGYGGFVCLFFTNLCFHVKNMRSHYNHTLQKNNSRECFRCRHGGITVYAEERMKLELKSSEDEGAYLLSITSYVWVQ